MPKNPLLVSKRNIDNFAQNKIRYVVEDLKQYANVPEETSKKILLARGFNKWIANRDRIIYLKDKLKRRVTSTIEEMRKAKKEKSYYYLAKLKGELKILMLVRQEIRSICHSPRWQFPK